MLIERGVLEVVLDHDGAAVGKLSERRSHVVPGPLMNIGENHRVLVSHNVLVRGQGGKTAAERDGTNMSFGDERDQSNSFFPFHLGNSETLVRAGEIGVNLDRQFFQVGAGSKPIGWYNLGCLGEARVSRSDCTRMFTTVICTYFCHAEFVYVAQG